VVTNNWVTPIPRSHITTASRIPSRVTVRQPVRAVLFDLDGTIADSFPTGIAIANRVAAQSGIPTVTAATVERWKQLSAQDILKEAQIPLWRLPSLIRRFKTEINREMQNLPIIPGMREAILQLWDQNYILGVVTSNSEANARKFLASQGLDHLFEFVASSPHLMGKQKTLRQLARRHHLNPTQILYVGDETRDIEAAQRSGMRSVAVCWGFNSAQALADRHPDFLIQQPRELVELVKRA
jgi:phosphoglycolate phosphatase